MIVSRSVSLVGFFDGLMIVSRSVSLVGFFVLRGWSPVSVWTPVIALRPLGAQYRRRVPVSVGLFHIAVHAIGPVLLVAPQWVLVRAAVENKGRSSESRG